MSWRCPTMLRANSISTDYGVDSMSIRRSPSSPPAIERKPFETPVQDVMEGSARWEIHVHDHGLVALVDAMPRFAPVGKTADFAIVQAARVSYGEGTKPINEDRGLIRTWPDTATPRPSKWWSSSFTM